MALRIALIAFLLPLLTGVATAQQHSPLEIFSIGENVYARALLVADGSLWVGTSAGVLEIRLDTLEPVNTFTREHGLANEYVFGMGRDRDGYLWFGTNAGGASRYRDGEWQVFFPMHGLADYWVYCFAQQRSGAFWIGTWAGVSKLDLDTMQFTNYVKELINEWVYGIGIDSQDRVWFGTEGGVTMHDGQEWTHWTHDDGLGAENISGLPHSTNTGLGTRSRHDLSVLVQGRESYNPNYVFSIHIEPTDHVWAGTWGGGAARFNGDSWHNHTLQDGLAGNIVYSITQSQDGVLWFGTNRGLSRFDGEHWLNYTHANGLPSEHIYALALDPDGYLWMGLQGSVARLNTKQ